MAATKINMRRKMTLVLVLTLLCFVAVVVKLFVIQFVQGDFLQAKAEESRTRDLPVSASRGDIYDTNGTLLAFSITADSVGAYPAEVKSSGQATATANILSQLLSMDVETVKEKITSDESFVWLKRKVDFAVSEMIEFENLPGVAIVEESQRFYPQGTLAAHVLGFAGIDNQGLEGVELSMDDWLSGTDGRIVGKFDAEERAIPQAEYEYVAPQNGDDIFLTIDENIQYYCERELAELMASETPPKRAGIIIMDPETGAIVAMACSDPYDPGSYADYDSSYWRNFLVSDSYEPGSVFKIITASAAMEEGTVNANSTFYDGGSIAVANANIHCWASVPHGSQNLAEAVMNSCNPAFVAIAQSIEAKQKGLFYKYIHAFGFGEVTGVDLSGEAVGIIQSDDNLGPVEIATSGIGQGIAVTPMQMITAACAVANDGVLLRPHLVSKVVDEDGQTVYEAAPEEVRRVISENTASALREMLVGVVTDGSGFLAAIDGYTIGGKTGTAQKAENGVYASGKYVASFMGMVPADDPQLVCLVVVDEPSGLFYGSQVAAPIFKAVMSDALRYLGVAPSADAVDGVENSEQPSQAQVPDVVYLDAASAVEQVQAAGFVAQVDGMGALVTSQVPSSLVFENVGSTVTLYTGGQSSDADGQQYVLVPKLTGKRFAQTANLLAELGLSMTPQGSGVVVSQDPLPGTKIPVGTAVTVTFRSEENGVALNSP